MNMLIDFEQMLSRQIDFGFWTDSEEKTKGDVFLWIEQHLNPKTDYMRFLDEFNKLTGKKYIGDLESRELFYKHYSVYSDNDRTRALQNVLTDPYIKDNIGILTPKYILNPNNLGKYISYTPPKSGYNGQPKTKVKDGDYSEIQDI